MQAIILDALRQTTEEHDIGKVLSALLTNRGWEQETFFLRQMEITPCSSCGRCAMDTPGLCFIKDGMEEIYSRWANCQLLIFCTPISFGGYHSSLKMVLDRIMPMNTPYFALRKGELHHANRYHPMPSLLAIGLLSGDSGLDRDRERNTFEYLIERNAVNMNIDRFASAVFLPEHTAAQVLTRLEQALKEVI
jgi:hypothetical protein